MKWRLMAAFIAVTLLMLLVQDVPLSNYLRAVERDRIMTELDPIYPGYGFAQHKGYGTAQHLAALRTLGVCVIHRRSFAPVRAHLTVPA